MLMGIIYFKSTWCIPQTYFFPKLQMSEKLSI
jgi:hypothetical protein